MKELSMAASVVGLAVVGIAWLDGAKLDMTVTPPHLIYNPQAKVYQLDEQTSYANQTLEQKLLTVQTITRHEGRLAPHPKTVAQ